MAQEESSRGARPSHRDFSPNQRQSSIRYPDIGDTGSPSRRLSFPRGTNFSTAPETMSSTVKGSSYLRDLPKAVCLRRGLEHDIDDSDNEEDLEPDLGGRDLGEGVRTPPEDRSNRPISPPPIGVSKRNQPSRRLTFNPLEDAEEGIRLTDESLNPPEEITITDHEDLRAKVNERPQAVMDTITRIVMSWRATEDERLALREDVG